MIRTIGMAVLFFTGAYAGYWASMNLRKRIKLTESLLSLVRYIENKIKYFNLPLPDIYRDYNDPCLQKSGFMTALSDGWESALEQIDIDSGAKIILTEFARHLGKSVGEEQEGNCRLCAAALEEHIRTLKEDFPSRRKVYCSLGVSAGMLAVILLM